ncbi:MAG: penicillin-binding protein activator LpoB [Alphaproteobacteria bacterium]|jgi:uncharacterized protein (TIGR02722 family)|nr:penicillin-binding protein activator LpoB [Alphaproteobacteria bacterium]
MRKYLSIALLLFLSACGGTSYQAVDKNTAGSAFSAMDQKMLVETLSNKLVNDQAFRAELGGEKPTLLIDTIKNKTSEHIDTESMTDTLKVGIVKSRMFSIINRDKMDILAKENAIAQSGLGDSQRATELGRLWGAKYVMYGNFSSIVNFVGSQKQVYYKFTLIVQNIETGEEVWIDEAELNKVSKKGLF